MSDPFNGRTLQFMPTRGTNTEHNPVIADAIDAADGIATTEQLRYVIARLLDCIGSEVFEAPIVVQNLDHASSPQLHVVYHHAAFNITITRARS